MFVKVVAVGLVCVLGASVALAHSKIAKSVPGEGATVKAGLSEITLGFSKPVRLMLVKVRKTRVKEDVSPKFSPAATRKRLDSWEHRRQAMPYEDPSDFERIEDGLKKAGLPPNGASPSGRSTGGVLGSP